MRLRLGILNEDLAAKFCIPPALCSQTFTTWIRLLSQLLGHALFRKAGYSKCRVILDCAEVFTERRKSLDNHAYIWSNYKRHSTTKCLVGISPNVLVEGLQTNT